MIAADLSGVPLDAAIALAALADRVLVAGGIWGQHLRRVGSKGMMVPYYTAGTVIIRYPLS